LSVFAPYSLDAPYAFGDGTTSRYEKVSNLEKHLIEWDNPVHDEAESDIEDWERLQEITESVDGRRSR
jgi:hypothetical protein